MMVSRLLPTPRTAPSSGAAAAPVARVIDGLIAIPVRIQVIGTYESALSYLDYLQHEGRPASSGTSTTRQTETPEAQGIPSIYEI